jgi:hypothetical protein
MSDRKPFIALLRHRKNIRTMNSKVCAPRWWIWPRERGLVRVREYSWERSVARVRQVYGEVAS